MNSKPNNLMACSRRPVASPMSELERAERAAKRKKADVAAAEKRNGCHPEECQDHDSDRVSYQRWDESLGRMATKWDRSFSTSNDGLWVNGRPPTPWQVDAVAR